MRVLSGVQSNGRLHLGNYLGAMKQHIEAQDEHECFYFIANYHSMTSLFDAEERRKLIPVDALSKLKTAYHEAGGSRENAAYGWVRDDTAV